MSGLFLLLFKSKALISILGMLFTIWVYAQFYGAPFAIGFVAMIMIHEFGHYIAAAQKGLSPGLPVLIPFMGWTSYGTPTDPETRAYVAFAGPFVGTLAAFAAYYYGIKTGQELWLALAYSAFVLNLFNLLPVAPLDGGQIMQVISPRLWLLGLPLLIALFFYSPSPMLLLIGLMALPNLRAAWNYDKNDPRNAEYRNVSDVVKIQYGILYLGLAAILALMSYHVHQGLSLG